MASTGYFAACVVVVLLCAGFGCSTEAERPAKGAFAVLSAAEDWSSGTPGGNWPGQWKSQTLSGSPLAWQTNRAAFHGTNNLGRANGAATTDVGVQYLDGNAAFTVDSEQLVSVATNSNGHLVMAGLFARRAEDAPGTFYGCAVGQHGMTDRLRLFKRVDGAYTELAQVPAPPPSGVANLASVNTWYKLRFRVSQNGGGTDVRAKLWLASAGEPAGWTLEVLGNTEEALQNASGRVGIYAQSGNLNTRYAYFDDYSVSALGRRWSDPSTWPNLQVPTLPSDVEISGSTPVILDVDAQVRRLKIAAGATLQFDPGATRTLVVGSTDPGAPADQNVEVEGTLHMRPGVPSSVHKLQMKGSNEAAFVGDGMVPLPTDVGLWVMQAGKLDAVGAAKVGWRRATNSLTAGVTTTVTLDGPPTGWRVGDEVSIAPTGPVDVDDGPTRFDERTISAISGNQITLSAPVTYPHPAVTVSPGLTLGAEVLNLTRNVRIEGMPPEVRYPRSSADEQSNSLGYGRAHVFVHNMQPAVQRIRYVAIRYMGPRQFVSGDNTRSRRGRYGLHIHHGGNNSVGSLIQGVVVRDTDAHAFVPHATHGVTFRDCIAYDTTDDAYWWDEWHQTANPVLSNATSNDILWERSVAAKIKYDPARSGFTLTGFLLGIGTGNEVRDSVAVGVLGNTTASGFHWPSSANNKDNVWAFPPGNVAHNNRTNGAFVWQNDNHAHDLDGFVAYRNQKSGIEHGAYGNSYVWRNATLYNNGWTGRELEGGISEFMLHAGSEISGVQQTLQDVRIDSAGAARHALSIESAHGQPAEYVTALRWNVAGYTDDAVYLNQITDELVGGARVWSAVEMVGWTLPGNLELEFSDFSIVRLTPLTRLRVQRRGGTAYQINPKGDEDFITNRQANGGVSGPWPPKWTRQSVSGSALTWDAGTAAFSVDGPLGRATGPSGGQDIQFLNASSGVAFTDSDTVVYLAASHATSGRAGLVARRSDAAPGNFYGCEVGSNAAGDELRIFKIVNGVKTEFPLPPVQPPNTGVRHMSFLNRWYQLRFKVTQQGGSTRLQARLVRFDDSTPNWTLDVTDNDASLQNVSGRVGVTARGGAAGTQVYFDRFSPMIPTEVDVFAIQPFFPGP